MTLIEPTTNTPTHPSRTRPSPPPEGQHSTDPPANAGRRARSADRSSHRRASSHAEPGRGPAARTGHDRPYAELVRAIEAGDEAAWHQLISRLRPTVDRVLGCYRVDPQLRFDAAADTWEILLTNLGDVRHPERLEGWIATVARNRMNLHLRRRRRDCPTDDVDRLRVAQGPGAATPDPVVQEETREVLRRAVARLSPREQQVIRCRAYTDRPEPLQSMQDRLGIPVGSIGPTLGRGVAKLRRDRDVRRLLGGGLSALAG